MKKRIFTLMLAIAAVSSLAACSMIGGSSSESSVSESVASHKHQLKKVAQQAATCEKEGSKEYWKCIGCDKMFSEKAAMNELTDEDIIIAKLAHETEFVEENVPTCSKAGNIAYWYCDNCNNYYEDEACEKKIENKSSVTLAKLAHSLTHTPAAEPNGKTNGNIEYWYCSDCENYYEDEACTSTIELEETVILSAWNIPDFVVEVEEGRDPVVLQLSDTQIIDAGQTRPGRTGVYYDFWATDKIEERCYDYLTEVITATNPDLIILTGDVIYGEFDDKGTALVSFINFMESFQIPWAPVFGNHDNESKKGVDWQCDQFEAAENCLFKQRELTGNGNYSVAIAQGGALKRVFYMMDTNACGNASDESKANGHTAFNYCGFKQDQIDWYTKQITELKALSPDTKISFAYHIQQAIFGKAYEAYGFDQNEKYLDINVDTHPDKAEGDFGYIGRQMKGPWDTNYAIFNDMKAMGVDSIFVGHEHCNNVSVVYEGVRFQYGLKSSEYDRFNCIDNEGNISGGYEKTGTSLVGGTVIVLSETDGAIDDAYNYYCGFENGEINWDKYKKVEVSGLQYGGVGNTNAEMWADGAVYAEGVEFGDTTAYKVTAVSQGKLYINTALMSGKKTFTFTVFVENGANKIAGQGQFSLRVKPDNGCTTGMPGEFLDGNNKQYISFREDGVDEVKLALGVWKTYTVNIENIADGCTEFSFLVAAGNVLYLKDVSFS